MWKDIVLKPKEEAEAIIEAVIEEETYEVIKYPRRVRNNIIYDNRRRSKPIFETWYETYQPDLNLLFDYLLQSLEANDLEVAPLINKEQFCRLIYDKSSKLL